MVALKPPQCGGHIFHYLKKIKGEKGLVGRIRRTGGSIGRYFREGEGQGRIGRGTVRFFNGGDCGGDHVWYLWQPINVEMTQE